jgi:hypothetical protein
MLLKYDYRLKFFSVTWSYNPVTMETIKNMVARVRRYSHSVTSQPNNYDNP